MAEPRFSGAGPQPAGGPERGLGVAGRDGRLPLRRSPGDSTPESNPEHDMRKRPPVTRRASFGIPEASSSDADQPAPPEQARQVSFPLPTLQEPPPLQSAGSVPLSLGPTLPRASLTNLVRLGSGVARTQSIGRPQATLGVAPPAVPNRITESSFARRPASPSPPLVDGPALAASGGGGIGPLDIAGASPRPDSRGHASGPRPLSRSTFAGPAGQGKGQGSSPQGGAAAALQQLLTARTSYSAGHPGGGSLLGNASSSGLGGGAGAGDVGGAGGRITPRPTRTLPFASGGDGTHLDVPSFSPTGVGGGGSYTPRSGSPSRGSVGPGLGSGGVGSVDRGAFDDSSFLRSAASYSRPGAAAWGTDEPLSAHDPVAEARAGLGHRLLGDAADGLAAGVGARAGGAVGAGAGVGDAEEVGGEGGDPISLAARLLEGAPTALSLSDLRALARTWLGTGDVVPPSTSTSATTTSGASSAGSAGDASSAQPSNRRGSGRDFGLAAGEVGVAFESLQVSLGGGSSAAAGIRELRSAALEDAMLRHATRHLEHARSDLTRRLAEAQRETRAATGVSRDLRASLIGERQHSQRLAGEVAELQASLTEARSQAAETARRLGALWAEQEQLRMAHEALLDERDRHVREARGVLADEQQRAWRIEFARQQQLLRERVRLESLASQQTVAAMHAAQRALAEEVAGFQRHQTKLVKRLTQAEAARERMKLRVLADARDRAALRGCRRIIKDLSHRLLLREWRSMRSAVRHSAAILYIAGGLHDHTEGGMPARVRQATTAAAAALGAGAGGRASGAGAGAGAGVGQASRTGGAMAAQTDETQAATAAAVATAVSTGAADGNDRPISRDFIQTLVEEVFGAVRRTRFAAAGAAALAAAMASQTPQSVQGAGESQVSPEGSRQPSGATSKGGSGNPSSLSRSVVSSFEMSSPALSSMSTTGSRSGSALSSHGPLSSFGTPASPFQTLTRDYNTAAGGAGPSGGGAAGRHSEPLSLHDFADPAATAGTGSTAGARAGPGSTAGPGSELPRHPLLEGLYRVFDTPAADQHSAAGGAPGASGAAAAAATAAGTSGRLQGLHQQQQQHGPSVLGRLGESDESGISSDEVTGLSSSSSNSAASHSRSLAMSSPGNSHRPSVSGGNGDSDRAGLTSPGLGPGTPSTPALGASFGTAGGKDSGLPPTAPGRVRRDHSGVAATPSPLASLMEVSPSDASPLVSPTPCGPAGAPGSASADSSSSSGAALAAVRRPQASSRGPPAGVADPTGSNFRLLETLRAAAQLQQHQPQQHGALGIARQSPLLSQQQHQQQQQQGNRGIVVPSNLLAPATPLMTDLARDPESAQLLQLLREICVELLRGLTAREADKSITGLRAVLPVLSDLNMEATHVLASLVARLLARDNAHLATEAALASRIQELAQELASVRARGPSSSSPSLPSDQATPAAGFRDGLAVLGAALGGAAGGSAAAGRSSPEAARTAAAIMLAEPSSSDRADADGGGAGNALVVPFVNKGQPNAHLMQALFEQARAAVEGERRARTQLANAMRAIGELRSQNRMLRSRIENPVRAPEPSKGLVREMHAALEFIHADPHARDQQHHHNQQQQQQQQTSRQSGRTNPSSGASAGAGETGKQAPPAATGAGGSDTRPRSGKSVFLLTPEIDSARTAKRRERERAVREMLGAIRRLEVILQVARPDQPQPPAWVRKTSLQVMSAPVVVVRDLRPLFHHPEYFPSAARVGVPSSFSSAAVTADSQRRARGEGKDEHEKDGGENFVSDDVDGELEDTVVVDEARNVVAVCGHCAKAMWAVAAPQPTSHASLHASPAVTEDAVPAERSRLDSAPVRPFSAVAARSSSGGGASGQEPARSRPHFMLGKGEGLVRYTSGSQATARSAQQQRPGTALTRSGPTPQQTQLQQQQQGAATGFSATLGAVKPLRSDDPALESRAALEGPTVASTASAGSVAPAIAPAMRRPARPFTAVGPRGDPHAHQQQQQQQQQRQGTLAPVAARPSSAATGFAPSFSSSSSSAAAAAAASSPVHAPISSAEGSRCLVGRAAYAFDAGDTQLPAGLVAMSLPEGALLRLGPVGAVHGRFQPLDRAALHALVSDEWAFASDDEPADGAPPAYGHQEGAGALVPVSKDDAIAEAAQSPWAAEAAAARQGWLFAEVVAAGDGRAPASLQRGFVPASFLTVATLALAAHAPSRPPLLASSPLLAQQRPAPDRALALSLGSGRPSGSASIPTPPQSSPVSPSAIAGQLSRKAVSIRAVEDAMPSEAAVGEAVVAQDPAITRAAMAAATTVYAEAMARQGRTLEEMMRAGPRADAAGAVPVPATGARARSATAHVIAGPTRGGFGGSGSSGGAVMAGAGGNDLSEYVQMPAKAVADYTPDAAAAADAMLLTLRAGELVTAMLPPEHAVSRVGQRRGGAGTDGTPPSWLFAINTAGQGGYVPSTFVLL